VSGAPERCIVCRSAPAPLFQRGELAVVRCGGCDLEWQRPFPSPERLRELYAGDYFARWGARDPEAFERVRAIKQASYRDLLAELARLRPGGKLLDLGCAAGFLLESAEAAGFQGFGLDLNPQAIGLAKQRFGDRVRLGELEDAAFPGVRFDAVTLVDVLEHVPDPVSLLVRVRERMAPGGVLAALLPNVESLTRRLLGRRWPHYTPEHLFFWTPSALAIALEDAGFDVKEIRTGIRKTYTAEYLLAYAKVTRAWLPPGLRLLPALGFSDWPLRVPTGEMLVFAIPDQPPSSAAGSGRATGGSSQGSSATSVSAPIPPTR
jgi:2-polyprenyl-3-methyl-5-hydroxy-6-metoxy-1,4-benzoquinol methylase